MSKLITLRLAVLFTRVVVGIPLTDTHNGLRAMTADAARRFRITQNRMSHATQILQEIASQKLRYVEVPVTIRYTEYSIRKGQAIPTPSMSLGSRPPRSSTDRGRESAMRPIQFILILGLPPRSSYIATPSDRRSATASSS